MNQRGFATLEVILMVMVIGILASIAVPRFTSVTTAANTAKIQADLSTIDTAIAVYQMEQGKDPGSDVQTLVTAKYLQAKPEPPTGKCYIDGKEENVPTGDYTINDDNRAILGTNNTADKFHLPKNSSGGGNETP